MKPAANLGVLSNKLETSLEPIPFVVKPGRFRDVTMEDLMKVAVVAPFFDQTNIGQTAWIDNFIEPGTHDFHHVPRVKPMPK